MDAVVYPGAELFVAIDNGGLWPMMIPLPDGELGAFVYNHPSHGRGTACGIDLWTSTDGALWEHRSPVSIGADDKEGHANIAVGCSLDGTLIVISGRYRFPEPGARSVNLKPLIRHSSDGGHSWATVGELNALFENTTIHAFGPMLQNSEGTLVLSAYISPLNHPEKLPPGGAYVLRSTDGGRTFADASAIEAENHNETALLVISKNLWLAASRTIRSEHPDADFSLVQYFGGRLDLFASNDRGRSWAHASRLSLPGQHPGHLLKLQDGRILLTYGSRIPAMCGIQARLSEDNGGRWSDPFVLLNGVNTPEVGYPATAQLEDGRLVTVYYTGSAAWHQRYHMGVIRYELH